MLDAGEIGREMFIATVRQKINSLKETTVYTVLQEKSWLNIYTAATVFVYLALGLQFNKIGQVIPIIILFGIEAVSIFLLTVHIKTMNDLLKYALDYDSSFRFIPNGMSRQNDSLFCDVDVKLAEISRIRRWLSVVDYSCTVRSVAAIFTLAIMVDGLASPTSLAPPADHGTTGFYWIAVAFSAIVALRTTLPLIIEFHEFFINKHTSDDSLIHGSVCSEEEKVRSIKRKVSLP